MDLRNRCQQRTAAKALARTALNNPVNLVRDDQFVEPSPPDDKTYRIAVLLSCRGREAVEENVARRVHDLLDAAEAVADKGDALARGMEDAVGGDGEGVAVAIGQPRANNPPIPPAPSSAPRPSTEFV